MWSNACGPFVTMSSKQFECSYKIEQGKMTMIMEIKVSWILKLSPKFKGSTPQHPRAQEYGILNFFAMQKSL
jgi:hypothetical protein